MVENHDEIRPVTALFADVVGSTALGERLGPDEVKALIGECVSRMSKAVEDFGGLVQAYMGDGICAYFGVPAAHEDDPERGARAALRILGVVGEYAREVEGAWGIPGFNVRVGINSGPTAVGLIGAGDPQQVALGDTTNVAARLQSAAEPGTIVVGEGSSERLTSRFLLEPLGELGVKGRAGAVSAWRLVGPITPAEAPATSILVGRRREVGQLEQAVDEVTAGRGRIILVSGETGMGKTRMLAELRSRAADHVTWLGGRCSSYGGGVAYGPFVEMLRTWLGLEEGDAEIAVRAKLRARLESLMGRRQEEVRPYLGLLLSVRMDPDAERDLLAVPSDQLAELSRSAYRTWVQALAEQRPVALAIDDLHWADGATRELAERLLELTDRAPVLFAGSFRPDPSSEAWRLRLHALSDYSHRAEELMLSPLQRDASAELVDALVPAGLLEANMMEEVVSRAEGNPLYLEELLRALLEAGGRDRRKTWTLTKGATADLPSALEGVLVARIDRLPAGARRLAQVAAVVGREFPISVVERLGASEDLEGDLGELLRAEIVRELRRYPELECTFRHGLLQEAALSTLTPAALRDLYGRVGEVVEELYAGSIDDHLDRLAFYFYRSDRQAKALGYLERAGEKAAALDAKARAGELWARARKVASKLGDAEADRRLAERIAAPEKAQGQSV